MSASFAIDYDPILDRFYLGVTQPHMSVGVSLSPEDIVRLKEVIENATR